MAGEEAWPATQYPAFHPVSLLFLVFVVLITQENINKILFFQAKKRTLNNLLHIKLRGLKWFLSRRKF